MPCFTLNVFSVSVMPYYIYVVACVLMCASACHRETTRPEVPSNAAYSDDKQAAAAYETSGAQSRAVSTSLPQQQGRDIWQKPDLVIALLGDLEGKTVADIGAGAGYFAFRMVPKAKKVIAIDIEKNFIRFMDSIRMKLPLPYQQRFEARLARVNDPCLGSGEAGAVIIVNTYGYIENRVAYLKTLARGMASGARLLIIDFKGNAPSHDPHRVDLRRVKSELTEAGFSIDKTDVQLLDYQYVVIATK